MPAKSSHDRSEPPASAPRTGDESSQVGRFQLLHVMGLVVGYGMAASLIRSQWSLSGLPTMPYGLLALVEFAWLGLAMSGPLLVGIDRKGLTKRTGPELCWLMIGAYWIGLAIFSIPRRFRIDAALVAIFQLAILAAIPLLLRRVRRRSEAKPAWTHPTAVVLIWTYPIAWLAFVLMSLGV